MDAGSPAATPLQAHDFTYSVVIPVYNSERLVGQTIDDVVKAFAEHGLRLQLVLVNDGSRDGSWAVVRDRVREIPGAVAVNLLKNYGQHHANLAGLRETTGDYVVTMDDDGQNPADQVPLLIEKAMAGHDVVFGEFQTKQAAGYRRLGSRLIAMINQRIFAQPPDLAVSNFRILRRDVVDRICASRTAHPYLTGQALMYSSNRANVTVRHEPRAVGSSSYSLTRIARLLLSILFSYSSWPLRALAAVGFGVAALSFVLGAFYLVTGLFTDSRVEGWTSLIVLLAIFNGFTIGMLSMLGEYVVRTLNAVSAQDTYHVLERVRGVRDPHFVVIGAQRCGTTYLRTLLDAHPGIAMAAPEAPEPKVFLRDEVVERGREWYDATWFAGAPAGVRLGEKSTSYLEVPESAARIRRVLQDPQIVVQLRDPVARAVSNWRLSTEHGLETRDVTTALEDELAGRPGPAWDPASTSVSPFAYLERGRYADQLRVWRDAFGERLRVQLLEDLLADPAAALAATYAWLDVDPGLRPGDVGEAVNESEGSPPPLGSDLTARLREWYADSDRALADLLGRPVPWGSGARKSAVDRHPSRGAP